MRKIKFVSLVALLLMAVTGAWAQSGLTPDAVKTVWMLQDAMPAYDIELQADFYTDLYEDAANDYSSITAPARAFVMNFDDGVTTSVNEE